LLLLHGSFVLEHRSQPFRLLRNRRRDKLVATLGAGEAVTDELRPCGMHLEITPIAGYPDQLLHVDGTGPVSLRVDRLGMVTPTRLSSVFRLHQPSRSDI
jgi:hypothetical protein